jgi:hypothetical protein
MLVNVLSEGMVVQAKLAITRTIQRTEAHPKEALSSSNRVSDTLDAQ